MSVYDYICLTGVLLSIGCYARVQWQRDYAKQLSYSLLNLASAVLLGISIRQNWNLAAFISNIIWGSLSLYGIYCCLKYIWRDRQAQAG